MVSIYFLLWGESDYYLLFVETEKFLLVNSIIGTDYFYFKMLFLMLFNFKSWETFSSDIYGKLPAKKKKNRKVKLNLYYNLLVNYFIFSNLLFYFLYIFF